MGLARNWLLKRLDASAGTGRYCGSHPPSGPTNLLQVAARPPSPASWKRWAQTTSASAPSAFQPWGSACWAAAPSARAGSSGATWQVRAWSLGLVWQAVAHVPAGPSFCSACGAAASHHTRPTVPSSLPPPPPPADFYAEHYPGVASMQDSAHRILDVALGAPESDCKVRV